MLYSIGTDLVDDAGTPETTISQQLKGDIIFTLGKQHLVKVAIRIGGFVAQSIAKEFYDQSFPAV